MIKNLSEVEGFEEYSDYSITSDGDVVSHKGKKDRILKKKCTSNEYLMVTLYSYKNSKNFYIHRLVLRAFCEGYKKNLQCNHKDENKINNNYENLEWLTRRQNVNYGTGRKRHDKAVSKPVAQLTLKGNLVKIWKSATEARKAEKFDNESISKVCKGKLKTHAGYNWCFEKDLKSNIGKKTIGCKRKVAQLDKENNIIKIWESETEAKKVGGFNQANISRACSGELKTSAGYKWKFI